MRKSTFVATAVLATLVTMAPLASAQGRNRGGDGGGGTQRWPSRGDAGGSNASGSNGGGSGERQGAGRQAQPRDGGRVETPPAETPRAQAPRAQTQDNGRRDAGRDSGRRDVVPQERREPQTLAQGNGGARGADGRTDGRSGVQRYAVPRTGPVPRYRDGDHRVYVQPRQNYYAYRYPGYRYYGTTRYYGYRYYDPYFVGDFYWSNHAWQPRSYYYGSNYGSNWDYDLGKLRLDIEQRDAEVYIDGYYAGVVDDFDGVVAGAAAAAGHLPGGDCAARVRAAAIRRPRHAGPHDDIPGFAAAGALTGSAE